MRAAVLLIMALAMRASQWSRYKKVIAYLSKYSNFYNLLLFKLYFAKQMLLFIWAPH